MFTSIVSKNAHFTKQVDNEQNHAFVQSNLFILFLSIHQVKHLLFCMFENFDKWWFLYHLDFANLFVFLFFPFLEIHQCSLMLQKHHKKLKLLFCNTSKLVQCHSPCDMHFVCFCFKNETFKAMFRIWSPCTEIFSAKFREYMTFWEIWNKFLNYFCILKVIEWMLDWKANGFNIKQSQFTASDAHDLTAFWVS